MRTRLTPPCESANRDIFGLSIDRISQIPSETIRTLQLQDLAEPIGRFRPVITQQELPEPVNIRQEPTRLPVRTFQDLLVRVRICHGMTPPQDTIGPIKTYQAPSRSILNHHQLPELV